MKFLIKFLSLFSDFFSKAGSTGHVFLIKNGKTKDKGLAWSGFKGPTATLAVVPTTPFTIDFTVDAQTSDKQEIRVTGSLIGNFVPATAVSKFDFTVDMSGVYKDDWQSKIKALGIKEVLAPIRSKAKSFNVEAVVAAHSDLGQEVKTATENETNLFAVNGINIVSCSITAIEAINDEVSSAIGAKDRQGMLTIADTAAHDRQMESAKNDRNLKRYEVETLQEVEKKKAELITEQNKNKMTAAEGDTAVIKKLLEPYTGMDNGKIFAMAIQELAKTGRIGTLSITPELMAIMKEQLK